VFNPIGPGQPTATVLGRAAAAIEEAVAAGAATVKLGPLEAFRDFVDVRDVARAVTCAIRTARPGRVVFNVARGEAIQVREMVRRLAEHAGFPGGIDERAVGSARSGAVAWQEADVENAAIGLGWVPRFELDASVRGVWETYDAA
jgi:nucleoside-diphosphate-sugar epimerase